MTMHDHAATGRDRGRGVPGAGLISTEDLPLADVA